MSVYDDIFTAANIGTINDVKYFIEEKGVNVNTRINDNPNFSGETALHIAAYYGKVEIVKYLISKGADVNAKSDKRRTPLHNATADTGHAEHDAGKLEVAKILISEGAYVNADFDDITPLSLAMAGRTRTEMVEYIESVGGVCKSSDEEETSPETAKKEIIIILIGAIIGAIIFNILFSSVLKGTYEVLLGIWCGIGLGGNIGLIPFFFRMGLNIIKSLFGSDDDVVVVGVIFVIFLWFGGSMFTGLILPLVRILIRVYKIKKSKEQISELGKVSSGGNYNSNNSTNAPPINRNYGDTWTCKKCDETNPISSSTCKGCGAYK